MKLAAAVTREEHKKYHNHNNTHNTYFNEKNLGAV